MNTSYQPRMTISRVIPVVNLKTVASQSCSSGTEATHVAALFMYGYGLKLGGLWKFVLLLVLVNDEPIYLSTSYVLNVDCSSFSRYIGFLFGYVS